MMKNRIDQIKLNYQSNVERSMIFVLLFLTFFFTAFKRSSVQIETIPELGSNTVVIEIPPTVQKPRIERPQRPAILIPIEDEDMPEMATIEDTDINLTDLGTPPEPPNGDDVVSHYFVDYEQAPQIVGGVSELAKHIEYPEMARRAGVEGTVVVVVYLSKDGKVDKTEIFKSLGNNGCDQVAEKAVRSVKWTPAYQRDMPVPVRISVPIRFALK